MFANLNEKQTFENVKTFFKNHTQQLKWIRIQVGFSSKFGCGEEYQILEEDGFGAHENDYIFGSAKSNYFVLKYTPIPVENFIDWNWDSENNRVYIPVSLTPRNLKDVICFFAQNKSSNFHMDLDYNLAKAATEKWHEQKFGVALTSANYGDYGKYLPKVGDVEIKNFANCDWTFGPSYDMCDYFNDFKQSIGLSKRTNGFLTNKLVDYLLVKIKSDMQPNDDKDGFICINHEPHTNFITELECNPAFVKVA